MIYIIGILVIIAVVSAIKNSIKDISSDVKATAKDLKHYDQVSNTYDRAVSKHGINLSGKPIITIIAPNGSTTEKYIWREGSNLVLFAIKPSKISAGSGFSQSMIYEENIKPDYIPISMITRIYRQNGKCFIQFTTGDQLPLKIENFSILQSLFPERV